jgi:flagellar protein FliO/FliZ
MTEADVLRIIVSLIFVIMLILAGAWLTRRAGWLRSGKAPSMRVLGAQSLGSRAYVAMVEVEDARLVLGVTPTQVTLLHTLPALPPEATPNTTNNPATAGAACQVAQEGSPSRSSDANPAGFAAVLNRVIKRQ